MDHSSVSWEPLRLSFLVVSKLRNEPKIYQIKKKIDNSINTTGKNEFAKIKQKIIDSKRNVKDALKLEIDDKYKLSVFVQVYSVKKSKSKSKCTSLQ